MKTTGQAVTAVDPKETSRALAEFKLATDGMEEFRDTRSVWGRMFGSPRFAWQVGWLTADGVVRTFAHISGWPPGRLTKARVHLGARFVIARAETGFLDKRRHHPFMVVLISGRRDTRA